MNVVLRFVRRIAQQLWAHLLLVTGCLWWAKREFRREGAVVVLACHRVLDDADFRRTNSQDGIVVREGTFSRLASQIAKHYEAVDPAESRPGKRQGKPRIVLTFDDGWSDNCKTALPIAREHGIPVSIFICPGLVGCDSPFWPERVSAMYRIKSPKATHREVDDFIEMLKIQSPKARTLLIDTLAESIGGRPESQGVDRTLSWAEIARMDQEGVRFGSHTFSHQILTTIPEQTIQRELRESKTVIARFLGKPCHAFAYPNGNWSPEARRILAEEGFRLAFTMDRGVWTVNSDLLAIPRLNVAEDNLVGLTGRFSRVRFEYTTFWKTWWARRTSPVLQARPGTDGPAVSAAGAN